MRQGEEFGSPQSKAPSIAPDAKTFTNSLGMNFVRIDPGEFLMGSPATEKGHQNDETQHRVRITKPFMLCISPVTQKQWKAMMGNNPSHFKADDAPVEWVSWNDAVAFCRALNAQEGDRGYRLPTEAQWEYACRAGTTTQYYTGGGEQALDEAGWYTDNSNGGTYPVCKKTPNAWGLYDMHGNVREWCSDYYGPYPAGNAIDPPGRDEGDADSSRVARGGSWDDGPLHCRAACRFRLAPVKQQHNIGFRVCLDFP
jgi:formylglycine-generating enzyme required for sulfatase activity